VISDVARRTGKGENVEPLGTHRRGGTKWKDGNLSCCPDVMAPDGLKSGSAEVGVSSNDERLQPCPALRESPATRANRIRLSALAASKSIGTLKNRGQGVAASTVKVDVIIEMLQSALKVRVVL
jgi:hypothetical protein